MGGEGLLCERENATGRLNEKPLMVMERLPVKWAADWTSSGLV